MSERYTYNDYLTWLEEKRYELIDGVPYIQFAPSWQHQSILGEIFTQFNNHLRNHQCKTFSAPFDLRLPDANESDEEVKTVLQPDILIICDKSRLQGTGYYGVPTLIVEITSPASSKVDKLYKFNKYEKAGVQEYWIVEPESKLVSVFVLQDNHRYGRPDIYSEEDTIEISIFPELTIDLKQVFAY